MFSDRTGIFSRIMYDQRRTIKSWVNKIRLYGRRGKGTAESFSCLKFRQASQKEGSG